MIDDINNNFDINNHLFVTAHIEVYKELCEFCNVEFINATNPEGAEVVNSLVERGEWIILHSLPCVEECFKIKRNLWSRIIWRTWGHDTGYNYVKGEYINNLKRFVKKSYFRYIIKHFKAVGVANLVDEIDIQSQFGDIHTYHLWYSQPNSGVFEQTLKNNFIKDTETINILLGHSGFNNDNHIEMLNSLLRYIDKNICIYVLLSYGDKIYIKVVKDYICKISNPKIKIIENFMPYNDFVTFISRMDIVVLDGTRSYALGNVSLLKYFEKKFYLNKNGIIKKAFELDNIPYRLTNEIGNISFTEFVEPLKYCCTSLTSYNQTVEQWNLLFDDLCNKNERITK